MRGRALRLMRPGAGRDGASIPAGDEARRQTDHTAEGVDPAVRVEHERKDPTQLLGVAPDRARVLAGVDADDGEPPSGVGAEASPISLLRGASS